MKGNCLFPNKSHGTIETFRKKILPIKYMAVFTIYIDMNIVFITSLRYFNINKVNDFDFHLIVIYLQKKIL